MKLTFFLAILLSVLFIGCKKVQPNMPEPSNICDCLKEQRSTFFMGEKFGEEKIDLDTIIMPVYFADGNPANFDSINDTYVYFDANYSDAISYEWKVGNDPTLKTTKSFGLYFSGPVDISVRLVMKSKPNTVCIPGDDGIDTIYRNLTITNVTPSPLWGSYYGSSSEAPNDYFTIEIDTLTRFFSFLTPPYACNEVIKNLPNGKINPVSFIRQLGSSSYCFEGMGDQTPPYNDIIHVESISSYFPERCRGIYDPKTEEIKITYFTREIITPFQLGSEFTERVFIGKKI